jgi:pentatricopeptide repeat protein
MNHRPAEARTILAGIKPEALNSRQQATSFHLALFEVFCEMGEPENAWRMFDRIDRNDLFPSDVTWIEEASKKLPPRSQAKL